ncbi:unnamed protein product [Kuraishia capsulata CBS 1993]|uniref:Restriction of telomere capping protein 4 n=1 Tax=Kuraishia capsulata CBS 1993 TaxID=1382522 RepID=W6MJZ9_9ASCO|nr:uncharacterized protein KUCA_T00002843001 [Kuraishia capsulata CBS 1993]CDK26869.1 unnamed protein product [Kuraishia capsulata CBS 1993]
MPSRLDQYRKSKRVNLASPLSSPKQPNKESSREPEPKRPKLTEQEQSEDEEIDLDLDLEVDYELRDDGLDDTALEPVEDVELDLLLASDRIDEEEDLDQIARLRQTDEPGSNPLDDKAAHDLAVEKYARKSFLPKTYTAKSALVKALAPVCAKTVRKIVGGSAKSYYYRLARELAETSPRELITQQELMDLKTQSFPMGYFGTKRGSAITQHILEEYSQEIRDLEERGDKVVKFLSVERFASMVLTCEVLARGARKEFSLPSLEDAYNLLELTCDYGWYIMDYCELE